MNVELSQVIIAVVSAATTWLLARLKLIPSPTPVPPVPQVPTVDQPLADCLALLAQYEARTVLPDAADLAAMQQIGGKITSLTGVPR